MATMSDVREIGLHDEIRSDPSRLGVVRSTGLLDSEVEEVFDRLTRLAVRLVGIPAAFISLVDADRDFYKSACGFGEPLASTRELTGPTFCHYTVQRTTPLIIPDTAADPEYRNVPTVQTLGVAAYVGVPLFLAGQPIGAFCAIDARPHAWTVEEVEVLVELAASAQREIELRDSIAKLKATSVILSAESAALQEANHLLEEQATELEVQTEELQLSATRLEEESTKLETARQSAERSNQTKTEFLAMMSHELRTPLNAIGGYAELIELGIQGPVTPGQRNSLERIQRSHRHLLSLINGVLNYAKVDAGVMRYDIVDMVIDQVLNTCEALLAPQMRSKSLHFRHIQADKSLRLRADREKTQQIVLNLLSNAVKFTESGGQITMTCGEELDGVRVLVRIDDSGCGIPPEQTELVFQPFVQVDGSLTRTHEGTGLGLAISRELARAMGGELTVESTVNVGSSFTLALPIASATVAAE